MKRPMTYKKSVPLAMLVGTAVGGPMAWLTIFGFGVLLGVMAFIVALTWLHNPEDFNG